MTSAQYLSASGGNCATPFCFWNSGLQSALKNLKFQSASWRTNHKQITNSNFQIPNKTSLSCLFLLCFEFVRRPADYNLEFFR